MNGEIEPQATGILYKDLPMYLTEEQRANLELFSPDEIKQLELVRKALAISLTYYDKLLREKGVSEEEIRGNHIHQFLSGSSHPPEVWLKMSKDTENGDYQKFLEETKDDPLRFVPQEDRELAEGVLNRRAA